MERLARLVTSAATSCHGQRRRKKLAVFVQGSVKTNCLLVSSETVLVSGVQSGGVVRANVLSTVQLAFVGQHNST